LGLMPHVGRHVMNSNSTINLTFSSITYTQNILLYTKYEKQYTHKLLAKNVHVIRHSDQIVNVRFKVA
jgi:hypothetical protein